MDDHERPPFEPRESDASFQTAREESEGVVLAPVVRVEGPGNDEPLGAEDPVNTTTTGGNAIDTKSFLAGGVPITASRTVSSVASTTPTLNPPTGETGRIRSGSVNVGAVHRHHPLGASPGPGLHHSATATGTTTAQDQAFGGRRSSIVEASGANLKAWWNSFTGGAVEEGTATPSPSSAPVPATGTTTATTMTTGSALKRETSRPKDANTNAVFGEKLEMSLIYAAVPISTAKHDVSGSGASTSGGGTGGGGMYVWGYVPVVVAKCGSHLKETATEVEGTFRVSGSAKRMKDLQAIFDSPPKYGKDLDWKTTQYTTHDVATILRRYLTQMPEPIIPHELYYDFRNVMADTSYTEDEQIAMYKDLILRMPKPNQYLLLYVLDMLSVFARRSDVNLMTAGNLATIFQPGIIAHPDHEMLPSEHALSQKVLEFLINKQDHFLIGMELEPVRSRSTGVGSSVSPVSPASAKHQPSQGAPFASSFVPLAVTGSGSTTDTTNDPKRRRGSSINKSSMDKERLVGRKGSPAPAAPPRPPSPQRADSSIMPASDSDDEAPIGGWYVKTGDPTSLLRSRTAAANAAAAASGSKPSRRSSVGGVGMMAHLSNRRQSKTTGTTGAALVTATGEYAAPQVTVVENPEIAALPSRGLFRRRTAPTRRNKEDEVAIRKRAERAVRDLGKMSAEAP